jgi:hypothetical protein
VAVRKLPGVESVEVSLERAVTDVRLGQKNVVTLSQLRQIIRNGGFNSGAAEVEAVGRLTLRDGQAVLTVTGSSEEFRLAEHPAHAAVFAEARKHAERSDPASYVVVGGIENGQELKVRSIRRQ